MKMAPWKITSHGVHERLAVDADGYTWALRIGAPYCDDESASWHDVTIRRAGEVNTIGRVSSGASVGGRKRAATKMAREWLEKRAKESP